MTIKTRHERHFNMLEKIAEAIEPVGQARLASLLVYKNDVVAVGYNQRKSHPFQSRFSHHAEAIYLHSETDCIKNALRHVSLDVLSKCTLYVLRVKRPDSNSSDFIRGAARPCKGCQAAIAQFGIKKVYYTTDCGGFECL